MSTRLDPAPGHLTAGHDRSPALPGGAGVPGARPSVPRATTSVCPASPTRAGTPRARLLEVLRGRASR
jgi:hypothetical protein